MARNCGGGGGGGGGVSILHKGLGNIHFSDARRV